MQFERGKALTTVQDSVGEILKAGGDEDSVQVLGKAFDMVKKDVSLGPIVIANLFSTLEVFHCIITSY